MLLFWCIIISDTSSSVESKICKSEDFVLWRMLSISIFWLYTDPCGISRMSLYLLYNYLSYFIIIHMSSNCIIRRLRTLGLIRMFWLYIFHFLVFRMRDTFSQIFCKSLFLVRHSFYMKKIYLRRKFFFKNLNF